MVPQILAVAAGIEVKGIGDVVSWHWIVGGQIHPLRPQGRADNDQVRAVGTNHRDDGLGVSLDFRPGGDWIGVASGFIP